MKKGIPEEEIAFIHDAPLPALNSGKAEDSDREMKMTRWQSNPITAEFQKELSQAILSAYDRRNELGKNALSIGDPENMGEPEFTVAVTPYEREGSNIRGLGRIYFEDCFVVSNVSIVQGKNGMFVSMPSYKTNQQINGKPVYQDYSDFLLIPIFLISILQPTVIKQFSFATTHI